MDCRFRRFLWDKFRGLARKHVGASNQNQDSGFDGEQKFGVPVILFCFVAATIWVAENDLQHIKREITDRFILVEFICQIASLSAILG